MQKTVILSGATNQDYGQTTISDIINSALEKNPSYHLVNAIILENRETSCKLLCVFETH